MSGTNAKSCVSTYLSAAKMNIWKTADLIRIIVCDFILVDSRWWDVYTTLRIVDFVSTMKDKANGRIKGYIGKQD